MANIERSSVSSLLGRIARQNSNLAAQKVPEVQTKKVRLAAWKTSRKSMTRARVQQLTELFESIPSLFGRTQLDSPRLLTQVEQDNIIEERLAADEAELAIKAWKLNQKADVEAHLNVLNDYEDSLPQRSIVSVKHGKRLVLEGGGRAEPTWDAEKLQELLGPDRWAQVTQTVIHPAQVIPEWQEKVIDDALVMSLVQNDPEGMEIVRKSLIEGPKSSYRLNWRSIDGKEKTSDEVL